MNLDVWLAQQFGLTIEAARQLIADGVVFVNHVRVAVNLAVHHGDFVLLWQGGKYTGADVWLIDD